MNIARFAVENISKFGVYDQFTFVGKDGTVVLTNDEIEKKATGAGHGAEKLGLKKGTSYPWS